MVHSHEGRCCVLGADRRLDLRCCCEQLLLGVQALQLGADLRFDVAMEAGDEVLAHRQLDGALVPFPRLGLVRQFPEVLLMCFMDGVCTSVVEVMTGLR